MFTQTYHGNLLCLGSLARNGSTGYANITVTVTLASTTNSEVSNGVVVTLQNLVVPENFVTKGIQAFQ
jgi:hypothetical protein